MTNVELRSDILSIVESYTAGSPVDKKVKWTYLTPREIAEKYKKVQGQPILAYLCRTFSALF